MNMHKRLMMLATPLVLGFLLFYVFTFLYSVQYSVTESAFSPEFVGFANYREVFSNKYFRLALKNTFEFIVTAVPLLVMLSLLLAMQLHSLGGRLRLLRSIFIIPMLLPSSAVVPVFTSLFVSDGSAVRVFLEGLGMNEAQLTRLPVYLLFLWKNCGFNIILLISALMVIPRDIYEAAELDGARGASMFFRITLPMIAPTLYFVVMLSLVQALRIFKEVYLLYGAYPHTSVYLVQHYMNNHFYKLNYQNLTTGAIIFAAVIYLLIAVFYRYERRMEVKL